MNITPDTCDATFRNTIRNALREASWSKSEDNQIDIITTAVKEAVAGLMPAIVQQAMAQPETLKAMTDQIAIPLIAEVEDLINDEHDRTTLTVNRPDSDAPPT